MAENSDENLIGYDPLAWMNESVASIPTISDEESSITEQPSPFVAMPDEIMPTVLPPADAWIEEPEMEHEANITQTPTASEPPNRIVLEATQGIQNVAELHETLLRALDQGDTIEIDASAIQQIDTTTLQLLLIMKRSAINLSKEVSIDFPSERFIEAATLLGVAEMLEVDHSASGFF